MGCRRLVTTRYGSWVHRCLVSVSQGSGIERERVKSISKLERKIEGKITWSNQTPTSKARAQISALRYFQISDSVIKNGGAVALNSRHLAIIASPDVHQASDSPLRSRLPHGARDCLTEYAISPPPPATHRRRADCLAKSSPIFFLSLRSSETNL